MRYFVVPQRIDQRVVHFTQEQMHHMRKVLRLKPANVVECFDSKGNVYQVEIQKLSRDSSFGKIISQNKNNIVEQKQITLLQALPSSFQKVDLIVEKCTELGITKFIFFMSKRSEIYVPPSVEKISRWKKIAIHASEQSERFVVPEIYFVNNLNEIKFTDYDSRVCFYESADKTIDLKNNQNIIYVIGPEGGWDTSEVEYFYEQRFDVVKPFPNILRTETAAIAGAAILIY